MNQNNISFEAVIKGLECCLSASLGETTCPTCTYRYDENGVETGDCEINLLKDAIALLKAQEPVKPRERIYHFFVDRYCGAVSPRVVTCGACGECLPTGDATTKYCPTCGRPVKWE